MNIPTEMISMIAAKVINGEGGEKDEMSFLLESEIEKLYNSDYEDEVSCSLENTERPYSFDYINRIIIIRINMNIKSTGKREFITIAAFLRFKVRGSKILFMKGRGTVPLDNFIDKIFRDKLMFILFPKGSICVTIFLPIAAMKKIIAEYFAGLLSAPFISPQSVENFISILFKPRAVDVEIDDPNISYSDPYFAASRDDTYDYIYCKLAYCGRFSYCGLMGITIILPIDCLYDCGKMKIKRPMVFNSGTEKKKKIYFGGVYTEASNAGRINVNTDVIMQYIENNAHTAYAREKNMRIKNHYRILSIRSPAFYNFSK